MTARWRCRQAAQPWPRRSSSAGYVRVQPRGLPAQENGSGSGTVSASCWRAVAQQSTQRLGRRQARKRGADLARQGRLSQQVSPGAVARAGPGAAARAWLAQRSSSAWPHMSWHNKGQKHCQSFSKSTEARGPCMAADRVRFTAQTGQTGRCSEILTCQR